MHQTSTSYRFETLDSWRGICAVLVALLHLPINGHFQNIAFFRNSYLFVDFFFVLSGFVIAASYGNKFDQGFGIGRYMLLRFGRVYPLHLAMLGAFVAFEGLQVLLPQLGAMGGSPPFSAPRQSADTIFANLLLVQSFGTYGFLTWNTPAWSIATEFWSYLAFALLTVHAGSMARPLMGLLVLTGIGFLMLFSPKGMNTTFDYGMIRCLVGFFSGVLAHGLWSAHIENMKPTRRQGNVLEVAILTSAGIFVATAGQGAVSVTAPLIFSCLVIIFAKEAGMVSAILRKPFFMMLGTLSFSVYMTHLFIATQVMNAVKLVQGKLGVHLIADATHDGEAVRLLGTTYWQGDLWAAAILTITVCSSAFSYRLIEVPAREWFRQLARPQSAANSSAASVTASLTSSAKVRIT